MRYHFAWMLVFGLLGAVGSQGSPQNTPYKYVVTGRVVDERGQPVPNATVVLELPGPSESWDVMIEYHQTDNNGRFRIEEGASLPTLERVLYVTTTVPDHAYAPISPPFPMATRGDPRFAGQRIFVARDRETDTGDVTIQVRYGPVSVHLQYPKGAPLFEATIEAGSLPDIQVATRTKQGDMVDRGAVSRGAFHKSESTIALALPEGEWQLEIASTLGGTNLTAVSPPLAVRESSLLKTTLRLGGVDLLPAPDAIQISDDAVARKELERLGFAVTEDAFVERARRGNVRGVLLFLGAGISANAKSKNGETALMAALREEQGQTARLLINRGADVNATEEDGATALMIAAGVDDADMVQLLLNKSADVNAKSSNGITALFMAVGNGQLDTVRLLISAGADVNAKIKDGDTPLRLATELGKTEIVDLLKEHGARD